MILGFKTHINGKPTFFPEKIKACTVLSYRAQYEPKLHTIRKGKRWKKGMKLHMATGVRTNNYHQFNGGAVGLEYCLSVQDIEIKRTDDLPPSRRINPTVFYDFYSKALHETFTFCFEIHVDGKPLTVNEIEALAKNDGFRNIHDFLEWFGLQDFSGQIIHWTTMKY